MTGGYRPEGFENAEDPLPRDMPDQQAAAEAEEPSAAQESEEESTRERTSGTGADVPDIDEAGAGPGERPSSAEDTDQPVPDEPTD